VCARVPPIYDDDSHYVTHKRTCSLGGHRTNTHTYIYIDKHTECNHAEPLRTHRKNDTLLTPPIITTPSSTHHPFDRLLVI